MYVIVSITRVQNTAKHPSVTMQPSWRRMSAQWRGQGIHTWPWSATWSNTNKGDTVNVLPSGLYNAHIQDQKGQENAV